MLVQRRAPGQPAVAPGRRPARRGAAGGRALQAAPRAVRPRRRSSPRPWPTSTRTSTSTSSLACRSSATPARLERVLWNLLSNAEKYGKPPFEVRGLADGDTVVTVGPRPRAGRGRGAARAAVRRVLRLRRPRQRRPRPWRSCGSWWPRTGARCTTRTPIRARASWSSCPSTGRPTSRRDRGRERRRTRCRRRRSRRSARHWASRGWSTSTRTSCPTGVLPRCGGWFDSVRRARRRAGWPITYREDEDAAGRSGCAPWACARSRR